MAATITITLDDEVVRALQATGEMKIVLAAEEGAAAGAARAAAGAGARAGTLPARIADWAAGLGRPFETQEVVKQFKLSRAHASMVLSRLAAGPYGVNRVRRGVYQFTGAGAATVRGGAKRTRKKAGGRKKAGTRKKAGGRRKAGRRRKTVKRK